MAALTRWHREKLPVVLAYPLETRKHTAEAARRDRWVTMRWGDSAEDDAAEPMEVQLQQALPETQVRPRRFPADAREAG